MDGLSSASTPDSTGDEIYDIFYRSFLPLRYIRSNISNDPALVVASRRRVGAKPYVINRENRSP